jgi:hypothetical protein
MTQMAASTGEEGLSEELLLLLRSIFSRGSCVVVVDDEAKRVAGHRMDSTLILVVEQDMYLPVVPTWKTTGTR